MTNTEKVHAIEDYTQTAANTATEEGMMATGRDMSKVSLIISILSVVLVVVLFFGLNQNLEGVSKEVKVLSGLKGEVATVKTEVESVNSKVAGLDEMVGVMEQQIAQMPVAMQKAIVLDSISDAANKLGYISSQLSDEQAAKVGEAMQLLQQVHTDIAK